MKEEKHKAKDVGTRPRPDRERRLTARERKERGIQREYLKDDDGSVCVCGFHQNVLMGGKTHLPEKNISTLN